MTAHANRNNLPPIVEYQELLARFGGPNSAEAQAFREEHRHDEKFQQRAHDLAEASFAPAPREATLKPAVQS